MRIVLATGIYPPDIGGPATYVKHLAEELTRGGHEVTVISYGENSTSQDLSANEAESWPVIRVSKSGGPLLRWNRYAKAVQKHASDADVIECFSSASCGVPLWVANVKKPKKLLRLGGDFLWERYTDLGGRKDLRRFYAKRPLWKHLLQPVLAQFDHIIFSTAFQQELSKLAYTKLPAHSVIENAIAEQGHSAQGTAVHQKHDPLKLLFLGRFVRFKNLPALLHAIAALPHVELTLVGSGPVAGHAAKLSRALGLRGRVTFLPSAHGEDKQRIFREHDLLVLPSFTEISPHVAVEARAAGLPVLLTEDHGLTERLRDGMIVRRLRTSNDITRAVLEIDQLYPQVAEAAALPYVGRSWADIAAEHEKLFASLLTPQPTIV